MRSSRVTVEIRDRSFPGAGYSGAPAFGLRVCWLLFVVLSLLLVTTVLRPNPYRKGRFASRLLAPPYGMAPRGMKLGGASLVAVL